MQIAPVQAYYEKKRTQKREMKEQHPNLHSHTNTLATEAAAHTINSKAKQIGANIESKTKFDNSFMAILRVIDKSEKGSKHTHTHTHGAGSHRNAQMNANKSD